MMLNNGAMANDLFYACHPEPGEGLLKSVSDVHFK